MNVEKEVFSHDLGSILSKKKKELGLDNLGIQKKMRLHHYLGDGIGQVALNSITALVGMLTYFYTDKVGIAAATVGTIMLLSRVLDAFTDLAMGKLVDRRMSKYGKARPWLLWMMIPTVLAIILLFTVPAGASSAVKNVYALITMIFATAIVYTAIAIPYYSLMAIRTQSSEERGKIGITRAVFGYLIGMVIVILLIPITNILGGDQKAWIIVAAVLAVLSGISLFLTFLVSKEENTEGDKKEKEENIPIQESFTLLFKNKYWVIMLFAQLFMNMLYVLSASTGVFYAKYILGNENLIAIMGGIGLIPVFVGFILVGPMMKKFGLVKTIQIGLALGIIASFIRIFMPYSFTATLVLGGISTLATIPMMAIGGVLVNNAVEYGEWQSGKRMVGMINSSNSFGAKIGGGLAAALIGWILAFGHYDGTLAEQPNSAIFSILTLSIYLPLLFFIIVYLLLRKYDLDEKYPQIIKDLEARKASHS